MPGDLALDKNTDVGILGAGAMGTGIALVAAAAGHSVVMIDSQQAAIDKAQDTVRKTHARDIEKKRLAAEDAQYIERRLRFVAGDDLTPLRSCGLVIEAIVEDLEAKQGAFKGLESTVSDTSVLATNTSSLSVAAIASACKNPGRVIGLHFFNPANVLPLVEVVGAITSDFDIVAQARALMDRWGKVTVLVRDTPGFIVNRVARPFYGESLRLYEEGVADVATIDWALRDVGGFKMGPFELMDLIGNDVNFAVTRGVFEAMYFDPRYRPSLTQRRMVEAGLLGRKTGVGYYDYRNGAEKPSPKTDRSLAGQIVDRVLAMLINEAADAVLLRVASPSDIDLAMTKGVSYPKGLLAWADEIGISKIHDRLAALQHEYGDDRYRPSSLLKRMAREGRRFYS